MFRITLALLASTAAMPAFAADISAEAAATADQSWDVITVTATRTPELVSNVPATVTVRSADDIANEMVTDIKELVRFEPGVSVRQQPSRFGAALGVTGRDGASGFNIRGLDGNRVLVQVDGIRVPDGFSFGAQAAGRGDYVDLGLIKSVEILRGPASALYGSDGLAGAVSFVTSDPVDLIKDGNSFGGRLQAAYDSSDDEFSETAILAGKSGALSAMIAYTRRDGHELENMGDNESPNSTRTAPNPADTSSDALLGKIVYETGPDSRLRLTGEYSKSRVTTDVLTGVTASVLDLDARDSTRRNRVSLDWRKEGEGVIDYIQIAAYWQDAKSTQFTAEDRATLADRTRLNTFENRVIGGAADFRSTFTTGTLAHTLAWGADVSVTRQQGERDGTVPPAGEVFPTRAFPVTDFTRAGAYLSDRIEVGPLSVYPAVRFDWYDLSPKEDALLPGFVSAKQDGSRLSPKLGAVLKVAGPVSVFANYAWGFKAPEPSQVNQFFENLAFGYRSDPNPNLKPETSKTIEGGIRLQTDHVAASVTGFSARYRNFISQEVVSGGFTPADPAVYQFINLTRVDIKGVEGKLELRADNGLTARLAIAYAKGDTDRGTGKVPLSSVDPLKLVAGLGWRDPAGRFGGQLIATHSQRKEAGRAEGVCTGSCYRPDGFTILDATAFVTLAEAVTLRAGVFNILDKKYAWWSDVRGLAATSTVIDSFTQPGRNASVSVSYRF